MTSPSAGFQNAVKVCLRFQPTIRALFIKQKRTYSKLNCSSGLLWRKQFRSSLAQVQPVSSNNKSIFDVLEPSELSAEDTSLPSYDTEYMQELSGGSQLDSKTVLQILRDFECLATVRRLARDNQLPENSLQTVFYSFRRYCVDLFRNNRLPPELYIIMSEIEQNINSRQLEDIFPFFMDHAKKIYPHLQCLPDLQKISDLSQPHSWYPEARARRRRIIYHAGPTNSGKTFHALSRLMEAQSGVYCGPLKLLASEVYYKMLGNDLQCDLITGDERVYAYGPEHPASHRTCTVEMVSTTQDTQVAVIDEIQMLRDYQRGSAWTRALLGVNAEEVHLCGEASAIELVKELLRSTGEEVEVKKYERITPLRVEHSAVGHLKNVMDGDCIVCFSRADVFSLSQRLEAMGKKVAVIYGGLPPGTKLAQASKFNDPNDKCSVMVATDAIGMGINLSIKRIIFYKIEKQNTQPDGIKRRERISVSQALQIAGRAGRFGTNYEEGTVTTFFSRDLPILKDIMKQPIPLIEQAGLSITAEQVEMFSYHLPNYSLPKLLDAFEVVCSYDNDKFFMCSSEDIRYCANLIKHMNMDLRTCFTFSLAPIAKGVAFLSTTFQKFARRYSEGLSLDTAWFMETIGWPLSLPKSTAQLTHLENVFDAMDLYLWLGYRFPDMFPAMDDVREMKVHLDELIQEGILLLITSLEKMGDSEAAKAEEEKAFLRRTLQKRLSPSTMTTILPSSTIGERLLNEGKLTRKELIDLRKEIVMEVEKAFLHAPPKSSKRVVKSKLVK